MGYARPLRPWACYCSTYAPPSALLLPPQSQGCVTVWIRPFSKPDHDDSVASHSNATTTPRTLKTATAKVVARCHARVLRPKTGSAPLLGCCFFLGARLSPLARCSRIFVEQGLALPLCCAPGDTSGTAGFYGGCSMDTCSPPFRSAMRCCAHLCLVTWFTVLVAPGRCSRDAAARLPPPLAVLCGWRCCSSPDPLRPLCCARGPHGAVCRPNL